MQLFVGICAAGAALGCIRLFAADGSGVSLVLLRLWLR